jgi:glucokinase
MSVIALDLGGTRIKMGLVENGQLLATANVTVPSSSSFAAVLPIIEEQVARLTAAANAGPVKGIGMAFPTTVDSDRMRLLYKYVKYPDANDLDLAGWAMEKWGVPLFLENDARAALVGEWKYGAGTGTDHLVMITIGTGVGSAVLMDGRLLKGSRYMAGNLGGHQNIRYDGGPCNCGNIGCLESEASSWALPERLKREPGYGSSPYAGGAPADFETLFRLADEGDPFSLKLRDKCLEAWSAGIKNFIYGYDPERIVIGGGVMRRADVILPFIQKSIDDLAWMPGKVVEAVAAQQPDWAGVLGMSYLAGDRPS